MYFQCGCDIGCRRRMMRYWSLWITFTTVLNEASAPRNWNRDGYVGYTARWCHQHEFSDPEGVRWDSPPSATTTQVDIRSGGTMSCVRFSFAYQPHILHRHRYNKWDLKGLSRAAAASAVLSTTRPAHDDAWSVCEWRLGQIRTSRTAV